MKRDYSIKTEQLIERMCKTVEREDFKLYKKKGEEAVLKTYDLFGLKRPSKVVWYKDIFNKNFARLARSARSARLAWSASSARSAWLASSARSAWSASSASSARSAWLASSARSAWSAWSARSASSARSAWLARSALDYDFNWYIYGFEYYQTNKDFNKNDLKYLEYCDLLMRAKEYGVGYWVEYEDTLYLIPTPLVKLDEKVRYHCLTGPAIRWKGGKELFYLYGVKFNKELWESIIQGKISAKEVMKIKNIDRRMAALKVKGSEKVIRELGGVLIDTWREYRLFEVKDVFSQVAYFLEYTCPSTSRIYISGIDPEVGKKRSALGSVSCKFSCTPDEYESIKQHA